MSTVYRRLPGPRRPTTATALLFQAGVTHTIVEIASGSVTVAGAWLSVLGRFALMLRRFTISLNDING